MTASPNTTTPIPEGDLDLPSYIDEDGVTELVVHGVGGAEPANVLGDPAVKQITGDGTAGMWRGTTRQVGGRERWRREAYSWGGLTSRASSTALWLLLTPFALMNMAGWMAVGWDARADRPDWRIAYQQALVRVLGLATTLTYVLFVAQLAMDLLGWQCTQVENCRLHAWWPVLVREPTRAAVLAAAVPLVFVVALHRLVGRTKGRYEDFKSDPVGVDARPLDIPRITLTHRRFWSGQAYAVRARWIHSLASGLLIAVLLLALVDNGPTVAVRAVWFITAAALFLAIVAAGVQEVRRALFGGTLRLYAWGALAAGVLVAAGWLAWSHPAQGRDEQPDQMPAVVATFSTLLVAMSAIAVLHAVIVLSSRFGSRRGWHSRLPALPGPLITVTLAVWLLFAVWTGVVVWLARWLSPKALPGDKPIRQALIYPTAYKTLTQASVEGLVLVLGIAGLYVLWRFVKHRPGLTDEETAWATPNDDMAALGLVAAGPGWRRSVRRRKFTADGSYAIEVGLTWIAILATGGAVTFIGLFGNAWLGAAAFSRVVWAIVVICVGVSLYAFLAIQFTPARDADLLRPRRDRGQWWLFSLGVAALLIAAAAAFWLVYPIRGRFLEPGPGQPVVRLWWPLGDGITSTLLTAIPVGAVLFVRRALKDRERRRVIGTAWDVATFWPRTFHPLAPPSYAERAVPELTARVRHLLERHAVLLLGHSQGAVVTIATLAQMTSAHGRERLSVITYGNPLRRLYMRWFPRYVNPPLLGWLDLAGPADHAGPHDARPHAVNFHRFTDPIGRQLLTEQQSATDAEDGWDRWLPDPPTAFHRANDGDPVVRGHPHGGYVRQSQFNTYVIAEVQRLDGLSESAEAAPMQAAPMQAAPALAAPMQANQPAEPEPERSDRARGEGDG